jgi:hypothetical protein
MWNYLGRERRPPFFITISGKMANGAAGGQRRARSQLRVHLTNHQVCRDICELRVAKVTEVRVGSPRWKAGSRSSRCGQHGRA